MGKNTPDSQQFIIENLDLEKNFVTSCPLLKWWKRRAPMRTGYFTSLILLGEINF